MSENRTQPLHPGAGLAASAPLVGRSSEPTIFEYSQRGRSSAGFRTTGVPEYSIRELVPPESVAALPVELPEVSERDLVAHFTRLSHRQYAIDLGAYPLGSCTMKYNPKLCDTVASLPAWADVHPATPPREVQGWLELQVHLEEALCAVTGMAGATLAPPAGASGELTGLLLIRAWHEALGRPRSKVIIPDSAHGTNPASVALGGFEVVTVPSDARGCVDLDALADRLDDDVAGIMLTNPNTLGLFEEDITLIADAVHGVGGLLYYDGANLNAIMGITSPGDMGFDIVHMNLHKTFATPHGGGGPGAGPVAVTERLLPFLPGPRAVRVGDTYEWAIPNRSIGRVHGWFGNSLVLARAYAYILANGGDGLRRVSEVAVLNANWLRHRLRDVLDVPFDRVNMHEVVFSARNVRKKHGVRAIDIAKGMLERGVHAPTMNFPLIIEEALMVEPTETESPQTLEAIASTVESVIASLEDEGPNALAQAPRTTPVGRVDEARAARRLIPTWDARAGV